MKVKVGDNVAITKGKDKGKSGKIEKVLPKEMAVVVSGINMYKRHIKGKYGQKSEIKDIVKPLPVTNITLICPKCTMKVRAGFKVEEGLKKRICKKCEQDI